MPFNPADKIRDLRYFGAFGSVTILQSLSFYKTLFSAPGSSTSIEIAPEEQAAMGLSDGLICFSIGLDNDIEHTYQMMKTGMQEVGIL